MELIMLAGIPTSGKSSFIKRLLEDHQWKDVVVLSTDNYIERIAKELNTTYNEIFSDVISESTRQLDISLNMAKEKGKDLIWDQTNLTTKTRKKKLSRIPSSYKRTCIYFKISLEEALIRNKHRKGKFIPENTLNKMYEQFEIPTIAEGFDFIIQGNSDDD
jgi:tRNA uridine 5-carbamoylmethylation protein Kti12